MYQEKHYVQRNNNMINSSILVRKNAGQKAMERHFENCREKTCQPRILYLGKLSIKNEYKNKDTPKEKQPREFLLPVILPYKKY